MKLVTRADASLIGDLLYSYDALGQRVGIAGSLAATTLPAAMNSAVYDSANRVTNWNGIGITYDANGNMLSDGARTYTWDAKNRLSAISGGATASFQYDAYGRRLSKTVSGAATGYLYDGANPVQELTGTTPSANILTGLGIDEFYRRTDTSGSRDMLTDALGSIIALTDSLAQIKTQYSYEPYGATTATGEANTNPFQYTGRENDGTGVYYYRARYYNPAFGRFVSSDPIGFAGGLNTYAYVYNNPITFTDPLGLMGFGGMPPGVQGGPGQNTTPYAPSVCTSSPDLFPGSCSKHDRCYYNPATCKPEKPKAQCDADFNNDMRKERPGYPGVIPDIYMWGVENFGGPFYGVP